jgi:hypothetical protein
LLQIYVRYIRPHAARSIETNPDQEPLLLNFLHGGLKANVGQAITHFHIAESQIHLTTTAIRSLLETTAEHLYRQGHLSTEAKKSVEGINGHSSAVVKNYYLKLNRAEEVHHARALFRTDSEPDPEMSDQYQDFTTDPSSCSLSSSAGTNFNSTDDLGHWVWSSNFSSPSRTPPTASLSPSRTPPPPSSFNTFKVSDDLNHWVWGDDHPEKKANPSKVKWSNEELEFIRSWKNKNDTAGTRNPIARCLEAIKLDSQARHIFHQHHVLNSGRLRAGYDRVKI